MIRREALLGVLLALVTILALTPRAMAQDPNRLAQLKISVWPEYDTPTVLFLLDGTLADKTNLPRQVAVLVPSAAQSIVTTWENLDGTLAPEQPNKSVDLGDGTMRVTFTTSQPKYRVEFYADLLRGSPDKTMDLAYKSPVSVDQVSLDIQQPLKATNFSVTPAAQNTRDEAGFKYFTYQYSNVAVGQALTAQVRYTKSDPNPSVSVPQPTTPVSVPSTAPAAAPSLGNSVFLLVALVVLGIVAVIGWFLFLQRSRDTSPAAATLPTRGRNKRRKGAAVNVFCTKCGNPLGSGDNFCPKCGTPRRVV